MPSGWQIFLSFSDYHCLNHSLTPVFALALSFLLLRICQWGEALALVLKPAIESSWSWMWRKTLVRAYRTGRCAGGWAGHACSHF